MRISAVSSLLSIILILATSASLEAQKASQASTAGLNTSLAGSPLYGQSGGKVMKLFVTYNTRVTKGQLLAIVAGPLSASDEAKARQISKKALAQAEARTLALNKKIAQLNELRSKAAAEKLDADRNLKSVESGSGHAPSDVASAKSTLAATAKRLAAIDSEIEGTHQAFLDDNSGTQAYLSFRAAAKFRDKLRMKSAKRIYSPVEGQIIYVLFRQGQVISGGKVGSKVVILTVSP